MARTLPAALLLALLPCAVAAQDCAAVRAAARPPALRHNILLFVPDGLRGHLVDAGHTPALDALRRRGVAFPNSHALYPTLTTPNASALATGTHLGDTGDFGNTLHVGFPVQAAGGSPVPFIERNEVLAEIDAHPRYGGDFLSEPTLLALARCLGYATATVGKHGPALIQDHTAAGRAGTVVVDDQTGKPAPAGVPLPEAVRSRWEALLPAGIPRREQPAGDARTPGTLNDNHVQQERFLDVSTRVLLPWFREQDRPFFMVYWSRDPDGTQHNHGDGPGHLLPGINGPTALSGVRHADANLDGLLKALDALGLAAHTDVLVASDHGFSTVSRDSHTSAAARAAYPGSRALRAGELPPGFLALDLGRALGLPVFDPDAGMRQLGEGEHPAYGNALLGSAAEPQVVVAANGGTDLLYLPGRDPALARRVVAALFVQDYVSGVFADDALGHIPGTLRLSDIQLKGNARTPVPALVVGLRSFATGCEDPLLCTAEVADSTFQQGQGMHGSFSRADTLNFITAAGPSFRAGFSDPAPVSNADVGATIAWLLGIDPDTRGTLPGRVLREAMDAPVPAFTRGLLQSEAGPGGLRTVLCYQQVADHRYLSAGGFAGRTVGVPALAGASCPVYER